MLRGGVIMTYVTPEQAKIAEDAGAVGGDGARASSVDIPAVTAASRA
jgi:pyridoxal biosynthesis lyase PdxS